MATNPIGISLATAALMALSGEAQAISRFNSTSMSCASIRAIVQAEGAAIFRWTQPPNIDRFDRLVAHSGYCFAGEVATPSDIPAKDTKRCTVFNCQRPVWEDDPFLRLRPR